MRLRRVRLAKIKKGNRRGGERENERVARARTSDVPDVKFEAVVHEGLDIEALRGHDVRDVLVRQLLEDRRLARVIQAQDQKTGLLVRLSGKEGMTDESKIRNWSRIARVNLAAFSTATRHLR